MISKLKKLAGVTTVSMLSLFVTGCGLGNGSAGQQNSRIAFAMTNSASGNAVVAFARYTNDGVLALLASYPTGGNGTGTTEVSPVTPQDGLNPLASQGSLAFSQDKKYIFALNAGSSTITSFKLNNNGSLQLINTTSTGGFQPNCIGTIGTLLYVGNVGNAANNYASNLTGFRIGDDGALTMVSNSTKALSTANAQPWRITYNVAGTVLAVTEFSTNKISLYPINSDATLGAAVVHTSNANGPTGSYFTSTGRLIIAESPAAPATGSLSSYSVDGSGVMTSITTSSSNGHNGPTSIAVTPDELTVYVANSGDGTISQYALNTDGTLSLASGIAGTLDGADSGPVDLSLSSDGLYLYAYESGKGAIVMFTVGTGGVLTRSQTVTGQGIPSTGVQGFIVR